MHFMMQIQNLHQRGNDMNENFYKLLAAWAGIIVFFLLFSRIWWLILGFALYRVTMEYIKSEEDFVPKLKSALRGILWTTK